jgi:DNA replication protein
MAERNFEQFIAAGETAYNNLLLRHYRDVGLSNEEFLVFLQMKRLLDAGQTNAITEEIGQALGKPATAVYELFESMKAKGLVAYSSERDAKGRVFTKMDFLPLYNKLLTANLTGEEVGAVASAPEEDLSRAKIFSLVEQEFGRPLTPLELEEIRNWFDVDHYKPELIAAAVQEAVLYQTLSLRYIGSILATWQKKNFRSVQEVRANQQRRSNHQQVSKTDGPSIPMDVDIANIDWSKF